LILQRNTKSTACPPNKPQIVDVPKANYIAVRGQGDPDEDGGTYKKAVRIIFAAAYTLKMGCKSDYKFDPLLQANASRIKPYFILDFS
jgi:hypothetical protein